MCPIGLSINNMDKHVQRMKNFIRQNPHKVNGIQKTPTKRGNSLPITKSPRTIKICSKLFENAMSLSKSSVPKKSENVPIHLQISNTISTNNILSIATDFKAESSLNQNQTEESLNHEIHSSSHSLETTSHDTIDTNYEIKFLAKIQDVYNSAIETSGSLIKPAQNITTDVVHYIKSKNSSTFEDDARKFMKANIQMTVQDINKKYENEMDSTSIEKRVKEYKLQSLLILEMEVLIPSTNISSFVNDVASYMRALSFVKGTFELHKFLFEGVKENYSQNLQSFLIEIGDELNIPLISNKTPSDSDDEILSSSFPENELNSILSSSCSTRSSSSKSSNKNYKKYSKRSDIVKNSDNRQILIPAGVLKKHKKIKSHHDSNDSRSLSNQHSPDRAAKLQRINDKNLHVRRNLFSIEKIFHTPKKNSSFKEKVYNGDKPLTPNGRHVLKTNFVAGTPSPKQKQSALQRRKSYVKKHSQNFDMEIVESPKTSHKETNVTNLELLSKAKPVSPFSDKKSYSSTENQKLPKNSFTVYTPESKSRLSLKLFSKILTSPTAHAGIKRCSKRLFDQEDSSSSKVPSKKPKFTLSTTSFRTIDDSSASPIKLTPTKTKENSTHKNIEKIRKTRSMFNGSYSQTSKQVNLLKKIEDISEINKKENSPLMNYNNRNTLIHKDFSPPTPLSLLHLTTSPIIVKPSPKKRK